MHYKTKLSAAIRLSWMQWRRMAVAVMAIDPREKPGINTIAIDPALRLYYDPEFVESKSIEELAYFIKSELIHPLLQHPARVQRMLSSIPAESRQSALKLANRSGDFVVHQMMRSEKQQVPEFAAENDKFFDREGKPLPDDLCLEEYFRLLYDSEMKDDSNPAPDQSGGTGEGSGDGEPQPPSNGDSGDGEGDGEGEGQQDLPNESGHLGGSGADGEQRPWDDPVTQRKLGEAAGENDAPDGLIESLGKKLTEGSNSRSSECSAARKLWQEKVAPKVSPQTLLRMAIAATSEKTGYGHDVQTFRRPSRRPQVTECVRPSWVSHKPRVCIVIDTSSSMSSKMRGIGVGMVDTVLKKLQIDDVRCISATTHICNDQKVSNTWQLEVRGGGGTSMDVVCDKVSSEPAATRPDIIILVTDGETPWPNNRKVPIVAAICKEYPSWGGPPPSWIKKVMVV